MFQRSKGFQVDYREHLICNYGPTGNIPNQPVYIIGAPCTACHEGTSCTLDYPALCRGTMIYNHLLKNFNHSLAEILNTSNDENDETDVKDSEQIFDINNSVTCRSYLLHYIYFISLLQF